MQKPDFETLVEEHGTELFAYLWRMLDSRHDAEDCLQDVFLRAFRAYAETDDGSNFRAWLYKIATNRAFTLRKKRARMQSNEVVLEDNVLVSEENLSHSYEVREKLLRIVQAVDRLPRNQRAAIMLRKYQQLSYDEIGAVLDCSEESARANVYQGLKKLRRKFGQD